MLHGPSGTAVDKRRVALGAFLEAELEGAPGSAGLAPNLAQFDAWGAVTAHALGDESLHLRGRVKGIDG